MGNSFQASRLMPQWILAGKMVVPQFSATLGYPGETSVGLNGSHLTIAKYSSNKADNFVIVATTLRKIVSAIIP
jgi:hypothetical protein